MWAAVIAAAIVGAWAQVSGITTWLKDWLFTTVTIYRWQLPAQFALGVLFSITVVLLRRWRLRTKIRPPFAPIIVHDPEYSIQWRINVEPQKWLDARISAYSSTYQNKILAGPYHAEEGCLSGS